MLCVVRNRLVTEGGVSNLSLGGEESVHAAAGDIINVILTASDSDESIDKRLQRRFISSCWVIASSQRNIFASISSL